MNAIFLGVIISFVLLFFVGGGFLLFWLKFRPKKLVWKAYCYVKSDSVYGDGTNKLDFVGVDVLERVEKKNGSTIYRLVKNKRTAPEVKADNVFVMGEDKCVDVLIEGEFATLLTRGYKDNKVVFNPMSYDRTNMVTSNMVEKQDRYKEAKSVLEKLTPIITTIIWIMGMIVITYAVVGGLVKVSDNLNEAQNLHDKHMAELQKEWLAGAYELKHVVDEEVGVSAGLGASIPSLE